MGLVRSCWCSGRRFVVLFGFLFILLFLSSCDTRSVTTSGADMDTVLASNVTATDVIFKVTSTAGFPFTGTITVKSGDGGPVLEAALASPATAADTRFEVASTEGFPSAGTIELTAEYDHSLEAKLTSSATATATIFEVGSTAGFPFAGTLEFPDGFEQVTYTSTTPTTFRGLTRGANDTTAVRHSAGVRISLLETEVNTDDSKGSTLVRMLIVGGLLIGIGGIM